MGDALAVTVAPQMLGLSAAGATVKPGPERYAREARQVRDVYGEAWHAYKTYAFGADHVRPVSRTSDSCFLPGVSVGLTVVEAVDTLFLMGLDRQVEVARRWLVDHFAILGRLFVRRPSGQWWFRHVSPATNATAAWSRATGAAN